MRGCTADGAELTELSSTSHEGCSLRAGQGIHNQWPNTAANHRAHANEEPLNPLDLRRLTGFQQHAQRKEETAAPTETSTSEKKLFSPSFFLSGLLPPVIISGSAHTGIIALWRRWAGRKRWFTLCWFLSRGGGDLKVHNAMSGESDHSRRFCVLSWDQVQRLDSILGEAIPIHGRGNFPTLSVQPRQIVQVPREN